MHKKALALVLVLMLALSGCGGTTTPSTAPSSSAPATTLAAAPASTGVTVTVWHYFGGAVQAALDEIVKEFNNGPGKEANITVVAENNGQTADLEKKIQSASESGVKDLPEIVHGYPDIMATLHAKNQLADLNVYLSDEELAGYYESYIAEGSQFGDDKLYLMPIAKSTELLFYNQTRWDAVKEEIECTDEDLTTWEGIEKAGKAYTAKYDLPFFVIGSYANFFYLTGYQQGVEYVKDGTVNLDKDAAERTYNFIANGVADAWLVVRDSSKRYSSDWINDGTAVCYVDSNSGTTYVDPKTPPSTENDTLSFMSYPVWSDVVNRSVIQQGAGMAVIKKGEEAEKAAAMFLAFLTNPENTAKFSMASGYIPVQKSAGEIDSFKTFLEGKAADGADLAYKPLNVSHAVKASIEQFDTYKMYYTPAFNGSNLIRRAVDDEVTRVFTGIHESFDSFYNSLQREVTNILQGR